MSRASNLKRKQMRKHLPRAARAGQRFAFDESRRVSNRMELDWVSRKLDEMHADDPNWVPYFNR